MAEILCGVVGGSEVSTTETTCEPSSRAARKRRMELRRYRVVGGLQTAEAGTKRSRMDSSPASLEERTMERNGVEPNLVLALELNPPSPPSPPEAEVEANEQCPGYGMISVRGRRREMEDAVSIRPAFVPTFHFFGVFDGHGCSHVAASCKNRMHEVMAEEVESTRVSGAPLAWKGVLEKSFTRMDEEVVPRPSGIERKVKCKCELQANVCDHVGSTAVVGVVSAGKIIVANCGDSRAVLCRGGLPIPLSSDHKPDRPDELQRIQAAGGRVIYWDGARVLGVLAMSRAIGDTLLKPFVTPDPEVTVTERTEEDEFLILASDGLWDVVTNETACQVARTCLRGRRAEAATYPSEAATEVERERERDRQGWSDKACLDAAILLTKLALARGTSDNVSVIVVDLRNRRNSGPL